MSDSALSGANPNAPPPPPSASRASQSRSLDSQPDSHSHSRDPAHVTLATTPAPAPSTHVSSSPTTSTSDTRSYSPSELDPETVPISPLAIVFHSYAELALVSSTRRALAPGERDRLAERTAILDGIVVTWNDEDRVVYAASDPAFGELLTAGGTVGAEEISSAMWELGATSAGVKGAAGGAVEAEALDQALQITERAQREEETSSGELDPGTGTAVAPTPGGSGAWSLSSTADYVPDHTFTPRSPTDNDDLVGVRAVYRLCEGCYSRGYHKD